MGADTRLGPYRILRLINRGGQGSVYLGYDRRLHRKVAIKIYRLPDRRSSRRRCLQEAQLVAAIDSPKVVQIYDLIDSPGHLALVMEYVSGCDLEEFLGAVRPSLASVLTICSDIAGALAVTRQQRIVHGDLKASNILITEAGRVKLTDFGISRFAGDASAGAGSFSAVSPEQYRGEPVDIRSDLFVLGCLMYRMLTGQEPFCRGGKLDPGLLLESQPALLPELLAPESIAPGELVTLMEALLQKDPGQRPANTHEVRRVLRDVSRTVPLAACNSLQEEAGPCFRQESAEDIPPRIPAELAREGRSRMETAAGSGILYWLRGRQGRTAFLACLPLLVVTALSLYLFKGATSIHIERPLLQIEANTELPEDLSSDWLVNETLAALRMQLGDIAPKGPGVGVQESTFYSPSAEQARRRPPQETLQIGLRCHSGLCVYGVTRDCGDETGYQQAVMFPDMSLSQWRQLIRSAIEALYP